MDQRRNQDENSMISWNESQKRKHNIKKPIAYSKSNTKREACDNDAYIKNKQKNQIKAITAS
jgi:hypothetical protein